VRVRLFNLIGPGTPPSLLPRRAAELVRAALHDRATRPLAFRDLGTRRDYVDVRDAARALALALERGQPGALYHVGSGQAVEGRRVVEALIREACPKEPRPAYEETVASAPTVPVQIADASLAGRELAWRPEIPFEQSVRDLWRSAAALA
jgi:nucleoside-diphosphate-sugar epimerase